MGTNVWGIDVSIGGNLSNGFEGSISMGSSSGGSTYTGGISSDGKIYASYTLDTTVQADENTSITTSTGVEITADARAVYVIVATIKGMQASNPSPEIPPNYIPFPAPNAPAPALSY